VSDSGRTARNAIGLAAEFSTCALADATNIPAAAASAAFPNCLHRRIINFS
jgi:hypothetical protein